MKIIVWIFLALFLVGNAFFVFPWHFSEDTITTSYFINYKKDSLLLRNVFPDSAIQLRLTMPPLYENIYRSMDSGITTGSNRPKLFVNVAVSHNLDFTALSFPFYKVTSFNSMIPFYSIIKASNAPDMDSTALIGNITINGKLTIKGICTPVYARKLIEKELMSILKKELNKVTLDINRPPDTTALMIPVKEQLPSKKRRARS